MQERRENWITKEDLTETLGEIIDKKINGNLQEIKAIQIKHGEKLDDLSVKMDELKPIREAVATVSNLKSFASYWAGLITPFGIIAALIWAIIKYIR